MNSFLIFGSELQSDGMLICHLVLEFLRPGRGMQWEQMDVARTHLGGRGWVWKQQLKVWRATGKAALEESIRVRRSWAFLL